MQRCDRTTDRLVTWMPDSPQRRLPVLPPAVAAPPAHSDRRLRARRRADHNAQEELGFLARCLDVLAGPGTAEEHLAALLDVLAETAGARRAAVLADAGERRVAVAIHPDEDPGAAEALASWLDARAPRSRAERAAAAPAFLSFALAAATPAPRLVSPGIEGVSDAGTLVVERDPHADRPGDGIGRADRAADAHYACLTVPSSWPVVLGFDFADEVAARNCATRMPPAFVRHAGAAIALVADNLATEREMELLRARDQERTRFVSTVAHELRTPLTGLGGYLELILSGSVTDPVVEREFLERSRDIVGSIDVLVGDLLELSRIESGSLRLDIGHFSMAEVCQRVVEHLVPIALGRSVRLEPALPPRLRAATGDRRRVEQILKNLVGNALKFTPSGGNVELVAWFDGPAAIVAVRDDGAGISPEDRDRIWDRFYRMASHERVNGTGLGLPIAQELARAMSGDLGVASVPRVGSSFVLVLPGPTPATPEALAEVLTRVLADEEVRLEERGMRRRLLALERASEADAERDRARRLARDAERHRSGEALAAPESLSARRPVRLRSITGGVGGVDSGA